MQRYRTLLEAIYRLYEHSGFAMAGAVAFSFVVSLFPFCIFLGALAGIFGGRELAAQAVEQLFQILPPGVAAGLAPQVEAIMGRTRIDLLTASAGLSLFFATNAIETLRTALNGAYRVVEKRPYLYCLARSMVFVFASAVSMLVLTWVVVVGPALAARFDPELTQSFMLMRSTWLGATLRYASAAAVISTQLLAIHLWLAAGRRRIKDVWPGVLLSTALWLLAASLYSYYLNLSDYTRFYAGLSQLMVAMIFFQMTAVIVILGAELNRGIYEFKRMNAMGLDPVAAPSPTRAR
ncbi:MAG: YihY/virulence factor BrkB family protein [Hyphomicrobium sp.]|uniref:YihY/virulence factor BrkB family protein n=1 Tax=Hyphomicrobium sp. TaxID=82 RepID=UPI00132CA350|nr:YihY/virulence factor BrkB family protein [Hyphomicrobium sp.]KAB2940383.1 MAG: YihY/virulence factor BrkB family protein [Hyphomicrobium sp.]MBZ0209124.1 YihY/virulence factor BrkB family protein [Hyphomicrobium sp.]MCZ7595729.1 YihY/virulence factor BrkB family protein [Hyphomicrobium sp.]